MPRHRANAGQSASLASRATYLSAIASLAVAVIGIGMFNDVRSDTLDSEKNESSARTCKSVKVKIKVHTLDIAPLRIVDRHRRSAQVWHAFSRDFTVLPAHQHVHPQSK